MKMIKLLLNVALSATLLAGYSCSGSEHETTTTEGAQQVAAATYKCPMACEGEKTYTEEGMCPVCNMKLEKVEAGSADSTNHSKHDSHGEDHEHDAH